MTKIGVIIPTPLREQLFDEQAVSDLNALGEVRWHEGAEKLDCAAAVTLLEDCEIGIGSWRTLHPGSPDLLAGCPRLRLWEHVAGSVKFFFNEHSAGRELTIASCKGAIADCVAEMTLGEIIVGLRQIWRNAHENREGSSRKGQLKVLQTSTVGVIGASEVGKRVIALLRSFPCKILVYDPFLSDDEAAGLGAEKAELIDLCTRSDAVTLHTPRLPATQRLVSAACFAAMADDTVFINTSRGECVDEAAMIAELERGRLFAYLDVSDPEPAADDSPLRHLPNVVLTSHVAGPATFNMGARCVADVAAFLRGESPQCVVTADMLERIA